MFTAGGVETSPVAHHREKAPLGSRGTVEFDHGKDTAKAISQTMVRDLWALRLQQVISRVSHISGTETEAAPSQVFSSKVVSSQSEDEHSDPSAAKRQGKSSSLPGDAKRKDAAPTLLDGVALGYIALLLLREPVSVADLYGWMQQGELLYHKVAKEVPLAMREKLPATYQELLEPSDILRPAKLQSTVQSLIRTFSSTLGMAFPPINHPLILYRWTRELALPIECFAGTKRLARLLLVDFSYATSSPVGKIVALRSPEVRLMALLTLATKLLFPFDDITRHPTSASSLSAMKMDWSVWATASARQKSKKDDAFAEHLNLSSTDAQNLGDTKLDAYLDWYESSIASEEIRSHSNNKRAKDDAAFRRTLFEFFPAGNPNPPDARPGKGKARATEQTHEEDITTETLRIVQAALKPKKIIPVQASGQVRFSDHVGEVDEDVHRVGSLYKRYRHVEDLPAEDSAPLRLFYMLAAEKAGVELEDMVRAVFYMERKFEKIEEDLRRKTKASTMVESESESERDGDGDAAMR